MGETLIDVRGVYKIYQDGDRAVSALSGVSLRVNRGEYVAVVGSSGSGKSTLMNLLGCLDVPTKGEYRLAGENVEHLDDRRLSQIRGRQIGFVFQGFHLIPALSALENVELPLLYRGLGREERNRLARQALEMVGLENRMTHRPSRMSGGQQQRVAIARAIAARPPLILADEPTGNLDTASGREVVSILQGLHREGHTVILITHDPSLAARAQRVVRIQDGKIVEDSACPPCLPARSRSAPQGALSFPFGKIHPAAPRQGLGL